jgi:hypothetical protein
MAFRAVTGSTHAIWRSRFASGWQCLPGILGDDTEVTVTYDVTSLSPNGSAFAKELEDSFDAFLGSWRQEITRGFDPRGNEDKEAGQTAGSAVIQRDALATPRTRIDTRLREIHECGDPGGGRLARELVRWLSKRSRRRVLHESVVAVWQGR